MSTASFQFVAFVAAAAFLYNANRPLWWRQAILLIANVVFLYTFSTNPANFLPFAGFLLLGFGGVRAMQNEKTRRLYVPLLLVVIVAFMWLKKYAILPAGSFLEFSYVTIGLSYILFRILHLMIDAHSENVSGKVGLLAYFNYTVNFLTLVSGPIQRYEDFQAQHLAFSRPKMNVMIVGEGMHRMVAGFFQVTVLSWVLGLFHKSELVALAESPGARERIIAGALVLVSYGLYLYFNFAGYTSMVIGASRFFRWRLPENFNRPFAAENFLEFWSRWHITLSNWLKTYVYNPLLLAAMRRSNSEKLEPWLGVGALFVTFFLVGVWHGRTSEFVMFGFLQGLGVAVNQMYQIAMAKWMGGREYRSLAGNGVYRALSRGLTFTWFTFSLVWFWANWREVTGMAERLGWSGSLAVLALIFVGATLILATIEASRSWILSWELGGEPLWESRYVLTVTDTAQTAVALCVILIFNTPNPDIVYQAF